MFRMTYCKNIQKYVIEHKIESLLRLFKICANNLYVLKHRGIILWRIKSKYFQKETKRSLQVPKFILSCYFYLGNTETEMWEICYVKIRTRVLSHIFFNKASDFRVLLFSTNVSIASLAQMFWRKYENIPV